MEEQSSRLSQQTVAVPAAAHSLLADEKEAVQEEKHSHCADVKGAVQEEEHNHHVAADVLEVAQQAARSLPLVVSQEAAQKEQRIPHMVDAAAADMAADAAVAVPGPGSGSDIPPDTPKTLQPARSAAHYTDSSSHLPSHRDSVPASAEDRPSSHSGRQSTLLTFRLSSVDSPESGKEMRTHAQTNRFYSASLESSRLTKKGDKKI